MAYIKREDVYNAIQTHFNCGGFASYQDGQELMDRIAKISECELYAPAFQQFPWEEYYKLKYQVQYYEYWGRDSVYRQYGLVAQLEERLSVKQDVGGS